MISIVMSLFLVACADSEETDADAEDQEWHTDELTLVVPYDTGGSADRQARALAPVLEEELDVPVLVENREGGAGATGTMAHLQNDPDDGSYIIYQSHPHFDSGIVREAGFEFDDFDFLGKTHESPITLFVNSDSEYDDFESLINTVESNPGEINYGMMPSSWSDITAHVFLDEFNLDARGVPFDGGGPLRTALVSEETEFTFSDIEGMLAGVGDDARGLVVFVSEPSDHDPDMPLANDLMDEMGLDIEFPDMANMRSIQVKSDFREQHPEQWDILVEALENAATSDEFIEWGETQDMNITWSGPEEAHDQLEEAHEVILEYADVIE
ncbi:Bug family tripartite tricarboxylate transporter substrate binding protein [Salicibibacter cibarius]|nr:tripartite tricarboxylate transporter substrate-binding protein [Salicibibacter cibarius]